MNPETARLRPPRALIFTSGIAVIVLISLGIFYWLMRPPLNDLEHMAQFLSITAAISILIGYGAYRSNWLERAPSLRWVLLGTYILASLLTFLNVWLTARLMFASEHDLMLATVLLVFAGAIAVALGAFITAAITDRLARLRRTTQAIQSGDLSARAEIGGNDEIALLAGSFNQMAQQLQQADQKQKELDALRRDLVAWAGHDLRTPLSSIRLLVEALADGVVSDPQMAQSYLEQTRKKLYLSQCGQGLLKSSVFGVLIGFAGCLRGMQCGRSALAVGEATTSAVVTSIVLIVVSDSIITFFQIGRAHV